MIHCSANDGLASLQMRELQVHGIVTQNARSCTIEYTVAVTKRNAVSPGRE